MDRQYVSTAPNYQIILYLKVFMKFKTPFWSKPSDANPRPIKYGPYWPNNPQWEEMDTYEKEKMGATGITDKHLKQVNH